MIYVKITTYWASATIISIGNKNHRFGSDLSHYHMFTFKIFPCKDCKNVRSIEKMREEANEMAGIQAMNNKAFPWDPPPPWKTLQ